MPPASTTAGPGGSEQAAPSAEKTDEQDPKKTEKYWRDRIEAANAELQRNQLFLDSLQSRVNALNTDFVNRDDPAQRAMIANDRQTALAEMDRVRQAIETLKKQIVDIPIDAAEVNKDDIIALSHYGFFSINATAKTTIYIDDKNIGDTPLTRLPLKPGPHTVKAVGPKGKSKIIKIAIVAGRDDDEGMITW